MKTEKVQTRKEYDKVMSQIESLLQKATKTGGFEQLSKSDKSRLSELSILAEEYEDLVPLMPILNDEQT